MRTGWEVLRNTMQSCGINSREHLAEWVHNEDHQRPQERMLDGAVATDARGGGLHMTSPHEHHFNATRANVSCARLRQASAALVDLVSTARQCGSVSVPFVGTSA